MRTYPIDHPRRLGKIWHFFGSTLGWRKVEFKQPVEVKLLADASTGLTVKIVLEYVIRRKLSVNHVFIDHKMLVIARLRPVSLRLRHIWNKSIHTRLRPFFDRQVRLKLRTVERDSTTDPLWGKVRPEAWTSV